MTGGYIGVDVFFVVSGFLITGILADGIRAGKPVLRTFWIRRVRRLLPALIVVTMFTFVVFAFLHPPVQYERIAKTALSHMFLVSNVYLWSQSGYFNADAEVNPLLHTWSLSVEEQFYAVFPFVVFLLIRALRDRASLAVVLIGTLSSFGASIYFSHAAPSAAFYLLPTRAWELGAGATLALLPSAYRGDSVTSHRWIREIGSSLGLTAVLTACFGFTELTLFPGPFAIVPVMGTFLVLWCTQGKVTLVGRLLEARPLVWIGLISYSLYLWHWVLLVAARSFTGSNDHVVSSVAVAMSVPIAWLSWRFVEQPFRGSRFTDSQIVGATAAATTLLAVVASVVAVTDGLPQRFRALADNPERPGRPECFEVPGSDEIPFCRIGDMGAMPAFLLIGDSHAWSFLPALDSAAATLGVAGVFAGGRACLPFVDALPLRRDRLGLRCANMVDRAVELQREEQIRHVFLAARWMLYTQPWGRGGFTPVRVRGESGGQSVDESREAFAETLDRTARIAEKAAVSLRVLFQVPQQKFDPASLFIRQQTSRGFSGRLTLAEHQIEQKWVRDALIQRLGPSAVVEFDNDFCASGECIAFAAGRALYYDDNHLSKEGSLFLFNSVLNLLKRELCEDANRASAGRSCTAQTIDSLATGS